MYYHHSFWFDGLVPFLLVILLIGLCVRSWRWSRWSSWRDLRDGRRGAEDLLAERFAKGEINAEEYERMRDVLRK